ncbi:MAG TPA: hypothetical protein VJQ25_04630 [Nitrospira sp.]|nr:hypothetical protein [Nitrospira sp.]
MDDPEEPWTTEETAVYALAEAMAYRVDPLKPEVTKDILERSREIVRGTLDIAGRRFVVLVRDSEVDAERLAAACGKNGSGHIGDGLRAIAKLTELPVE